MSQITANASASITIDGTNVVTGSISWAPPSLPSEILSFDSVIINGRWQWTGKQKVTYIDINGTRTSDNTQFSIPLSATVTPPLTITAQGGHKNATGNTFNWTGLQVVYTYYNYKNITVTQSTGGTISAPSQAEPGDTVRITATPNTGYQLDTLYVNGAAITGSSFSMPDGDAAITVTWKKIQYTLTIGACTGCSVSLDKSTATYGDLVTITVNIANGYKEPVTIYVNGSAITGNTFTMPVQNTTVYAVATADQAIHIKQNGTWVKVNEVYKKVNGVWVLQKDLSSVFDKGKTHVNKKKLKGR